MSEIHDIINQIRMQHGVPWICWSKGMARLAQDQTNYCAKVGGLVHSDRPAFWGGENLMQGHWRSSPWDVVNCWMYSHAGHREYLLSTLVKSAGVGVAYAGGWMYVAWAFSNQYPSISDCPRELCPFFVKTTNRRGKYVEKCNARRAVSEKEARQWSETAMLMESTVRHGLW